MPLWFRETSSEHQPRWCAAYAQRRSTALWNGTTVESLEIALEEAQWNPV